MPKFRVELGKIKPMNTRRNPFHPGAIHGTTEVEIRKWEFEAKDEDEVRNFFADAKENDLPGVRGFDLRSINLVEA